MTTNQNQTQPSFPTDWNLKLLYQDSQDPQIAQDLKDHREKRRAFAEKYKDRTDYLSDPNQLLIALTEYEQLLDDLNGSRPLMYFHYLIALDSSKTENHAQLNKITNQLVKAHNQLTFFPIKLGKIDKALQEKFLHTDTLKKYHYLLQRRFLLAKYDLQEEQEKLLNLTYQTSHQMWVKGVEKSLNQLTVKFEDQTLTLAEASQLISELPVKQRRQLHRQLLSTVATVKDFAEAELNAIVSYKKTEDELRGYQFPYEETVHLAENNPETIKLLADTITENFDIAHRFYQLKTRLLNEKFLTYADRSAQINSIKRNYDFAQAYQIVFKTFHKLDPKFSSILEEMVSQGQLDVYPKKGKVGGAFCSNSTHNPTYVLLNHTNDFNSVATLAHEMGHAIHSELSKTQPVIYEDYSTSTSETASTFFEQFVFEELIKDFSATDKIVVLHNRIQDDVNTIFRQIALFNFELELHTLIKTEGYLETQQIGALLNKHMQSYLGPSFKLTDQDGLFFILWPHIRLFFYTYTYAFGQLISKALVAKVKEKPDTIKQVKTFLSAGGKDTPSNLLQKIGIDITNPAFFKLGLESIRKDIDQLETLMKAR